MFEGGSVGHRVLAAVGIRNGSFHLEAIEAPDALVFLEVGNRVGGADVVATFELATGVHLPSEELRILIGDGPRATCRKRRLQVCGMAGLFSPDIRARTLPMKVSKASTCTGATLRSFDGWSYQLAVRCCAK